MSRGRRDAPSGAPNQRGDCVGWVADGRRDISEQRASARRSPTVTMSHNGKSTSQVGRGEGGGVPRRGSKPMEGTDVWPVRAGHHGLVSGATPRRRPLCLDGPEALISVSAEELERDRAGAHVWSSDRASRLRTCIAADSSAAVALHGAAGTWRPTSVGSSFPVQAGVDLGPVLDRHPLHQAQRQGGNDRGDTARLRRGQTSKGSCTIGKASLAPSPR
jgi:hypothetical protein